MVAVQCSLFLILCFLRREVCVLERVCSVHCSYVKADSSSSHFTVEGRNSRTFSTLTGKTDFFRTPVSHLTRSCCDFFIFFFSPSRKHISTKADKQPHTRSLNASLKTLCFWTGLENIQKKLESLQRHSLETNLGNRLF